MAGRKRNRTIEAKEQALDGRLYAVAMALTLSMRDHVEVQLDAVRHGRAYLHPKA